jgi:hypothetical protein
VAHQAKGREGKQLVREAAVEYEAGSSESIVEVFWMAFSGLSKDAQQAFLRKLLEDPEWFEDLADSIAIMETRGEPTRPYREVREELIREGLL